VGHFLSFLEEHSYSSSLTLILWLDGKKKKKKTTDESLFHFITYKKKRKKVTAQKESYFRIYLVEF